MLDIARLIAWLSGTGTEKKDSQPLPSDRRRFQRLNLKECRVFIGDAGPFPILNLSFGGMRIDLSSYENLSQLQIGQKYNSDIFLENILINNQVTVKNLSEGLAGCSFSPLSITEARILKDFLKPRMLGFSLREIDAAKLKNDTPELRMRWFQGDDGTQIFLWQTTNGENVRQEFYFLDYFISWKKANEGIKTGIIKETARQGFGRISPDSVAFFHIPSYRALKLGQTILSFANLPIEAKEQLIERIAGEEQRLYHRYVIKNNEVYFVPETAKNLLIPVLNLSLNGMAILTSPNFPVQTQKSFSGTLHLGSQQIKIDFSPIYKEAQFCGGNMETTPEGKRIFSEFLAPRLLGQYLEKVPAPIEVPFFAGPGCTISLYTGLNNTHILSLLDPEGKLIAGRIAFMDNLIRFHRRNFTMHQCLEGIIFPGDWDIPAHLLKSEEPLNEAGSFFCNELLSGSPLPDELKNAWLQMLGETDNC